MERRKFVITGIASLGAFTGCVGVSDLNSSFFRSTDQYTITDYRNTRTTSPDSPLLFNSRLIDKSITEQSPGKVQFEIKNRTDHNLFLSSSPDPPFGLNYATPVKYSDSPGSSAAVDASFPLWQQDYNSADSGVEILKHGKITNVNSSIVVTKLSPMKKISQNFQLRHDTVNVSHGKYFISLSIGYAYNKNRPNKTPDPSLFDRTSVDPRISFKIS